MKRADIRAGRTYQGRNGERRRVTVILRSGTRPVLAYDPMEGAGAAMIGVSLDDFARWARMEVGGPDSPAPRSP